MSTSNPVAQAVPAITCCPHCDSKKIEQIADRTYEAASTMTWFQCRDCQRMWSQPKTDAHRDASAIVADKPAHR